jgi:hypothetical protein
MHPQQNRASGVRMDEFILNVMAESVNNDWKADAAKAASMGGKPHSESTL